MFESIDELIAGLGAERYVPGRDVATNVFLALRLGRPLLVEGAPGLGKSELARCLAATLGTELITLTCHAQIDEHEAAYEWDVAKQLLRIRLAEANREPFERVERELHGRDYLISRPLLAAFTASAPAPVLLVDGIDQAGRPFEAFLAEALSTFAFTIPGYGPVRAREAPVVVVTSTGSRPLSGALQRTCIFQHVEYPPFQDELAILMARVPGISRALAGSICNFVGRLRAMPGLVRPPALAEAIAWGQALVLLRRGELTGEVVDQTLGCLLKEPADIARFRRKPAEALLRPAFDRAG